MENKMITCDQHDYIEIVCTFGYPIKITMTSGAVIEGVGLDTEFDENREECIKVDAKGVVSLVILDNISALEVCVDNPHFKTLSFS
jgi:Rho-binding antiterminator|tara:strand:+ start:2561 stop:2818 length:258 start_codon:yes stop_codon:yes gene_type:complete